MDNTEIVLIVDNPTQRLDKFVLANLDGMSRTQVQTLIREGLVTVDGKVEKTGFKFKGGETVRVILPVEEETELEPEDIELTIIYEDDDLAVINKPAGMVVHPGIGNETGTLVNAILARYPELADMFDDDETQERLGIVHRLDKGTSGLIVVARNKASLLHLMGQFQDRTVDKSYLALLEKTPKSSLGVVDAPIARDPRQRKRMWVTRDGKEATTEFEIVDNDLQGDRALVKCKLLTGRTHQIRVHMAFIGCPIVGDTVYGFRKQRLKLKRQFLHAAELAFDHPTTGERMEFSLPLPMSLQNILEKLKQL
jgi:23S rRNA pseudouridine1911/1915/1917 synthase